MARPMRADPPPLRPAWVGSGDTRPWYLGARPTETPTVPRPRPGYGSTGSPLLPLTRVSREPSRGGARHARGRRAGARLQRRRGAARGRGRGGPVWAGRLRSVYDRALIGVAPAPPATAHARRIEVHVGGRRRVRAGGAAVGDAPRCLLCPRRLTVRQTSRLGRRLSGADSGRHQRPARYIRVGHLNVNRLMPSLDDVNLILSDQNLDILCLSETFLSARVDARFFIFPGYAVIRRDRPTNRVEACALFTNSTWT